MKNNVIALAAAAAAAMAAAPASAGIVLANSGFASATNTIDFEGAGAADTVVTTVGGVSFGGTVFQPSSVTCNNYSPALTGTGCIGNFPTQLGNPAQPAGTNPWSMTFGGDLGSLAFGFVSNGDLEIELFDGSAAVVGGSATLDIGSITAKGFVQISGFTFDRVTVKVVNAPSGAANIMLADNLQFSAPTNDVPEPGSLALAAIALGSVSVAVRRRQRRPTA